MLPLSGLDAPNIEDASAKLLQVMRQFEERVAEHMRKYMSLRSDPLGRVEETRQSEQVMEVIPAEAEGGASAVPVGPPWPTVVGRRARRGGEATPRRRMPPPSVKESCVKRRLNAGMQESGSRRPRSAAIVVKSVGADKSAADLMRLARDSIPSDSVDVRNMRVREAVDGGLVIEIFGEESGKRADKLAEGLKSALADTARITRPIRLSTFRLNGLDPATGREDVRAAIASNGDCLMDEVSVSEIRRLAGGRRIAWAKCPTVSTERLSQQGRVSIGWSAVIIDSCRIQRVQCFRCWNFGHTRETCRTLVDRSSLCFRCGQDGHKVKDCRNVAHCALCDCNKLDSNHWGAKAQVTLYLTDRRIYM